MARRPADRYVSAQELARAFTKACTAGIDDAARRRGDFDGFPWEPPRVDPRRMTAADFLRILD